MASNSSNSATSADPLGRPEVQIGFEVFFAVVICLVSIFGNFLVVFVVNKDSRLKSITNIFIHNLAWTDICMAALHMPFWIISLWTGRWIFSVQLCGWAAAMQFSFGIASILNMGVIAVNRYLKVVKPNIYRKFFGNKRIARVYCLVVWLFSMLLSTTPLYGWGKMAFHPGFAVCSLVWEIQHISYVIVIVGIVVNGVTFVIFYCYYKIYRAVKASSANLSSHAAQNNMPNSGLNNMSQTTDIKLMKATFTVVCVFVMCWSPVSLVVFYETIFDGPPRLVNTVVVFLMFCSSGANPVIYGVMNPQFKRAFAKVLKCKKAGVNGETSHSVGAQVTVTVPARAELVIVKPK